MMKITPAAFLIVPAFVLGCSTSSRVPGKPEPVPAPSSLPATSSNTRTTWTISPSTDTQSYRSSTRTLLELTDSAATTNDSIRSVVDFALALTRAPDALSYTATIESISVQGSERTGTTTPSAHLPFSFAGQLRQNKVTINPPAGQPVEIVTDCSNEALSAAAAVQRLLVPVPSLLRKDMVWTDSTSARICSGSIPVTTTTARSYKVLGETEKGILIERQDRTAATGEGSQGQHRIRLRSTGTGASQMIIDSGTGALVESAGTHTASVVITASGKDRKFTQTTYERISRR